MSITDAVERKARQYPLGTTLQYYTQPEIAELLVHVRTLEAELKNLEVCPRCFIMKGYHHDDDCSLAKLLEGGE